MAYEPTGDGNTAPHSVFQKGKVENLWYVSASAKCLISFYWGATAEDQSLLPDFRAMQVSTELNIFFKKAIYVSCSSVIYLAEAVALLVGSFAHQYQLKDLHDSVVGTGLRGSRPVQRPLTCHPPQNTKRRSGESGAFSGVGTPGCWRRLARWINFVFVSVCSLSTHARDTGEKTNSNLSHLPFRDACIL